MLGRVVSTKLKNTATVLVERQNMHPLYRKAYLRSKKYLAHDSIGVQMGDVVEIVKVAPVSKMKHFKIVKVLGKQLEEITEEKLKEQAKGVIEEVMSAEDRLSVVSKPVTEKPKTDKPKSENRKQRTDNRKKKEEK